MYKLLSRTQALKDDGTIFPLSEGNRQHNEYKKWLSEGNIPTADPDSLVIVNTYETVTEKWTKEGEPNETEQPMIPERWSDGITTVYSEEEIPTELDTEGNEIQDPDFIRFAPTEDNSYQYVAAVPAYFEIVDNTSVIDAKLANANLDQIIANSRAFGNKLINDFIKGNLILGITAAGMTSHVRKATSEVTLALLTGSLYDAIDEIRAIPDSDKDDVFLTDERLQEFINVIEDFLD